MINYSLSELIQRGLISQIAEKTQELLEFTLPLDLINQEIIPALSLVGKDFESGQIFLPQLLNSAEASSQAFCIIKEMMPQGVTNGNSVILATVKGDIHDIGKNIVKLLLESYGFTVYDLGKDVAPQTILEATQKYNCNMVGLSALMTTTMDSMREVVELSRKRGLGIDFIVGGAVVDETFADSIGAVYGNTPMDTVRAAQKLTGNI